MAKWVCAPLLSVLLLAPAATARGAMPTLGAELRRNASQGLIGYGVPSYWQASSAAAGLWGPGPAPRTGSSGWSAPRENIDSQMQIEEWGGRASSDLADHNRVFFHSWRTITLVELTLLSVTATLPKDWTGWSGHFVQDGLGNLRDAYSGPPVWDSDIWFHNYVGHPYGGSVYYNTVRCQGASKTTSFLFVTLMSTQWEYIFEAVAEQPSIQDLIITPIIGGLVGEVVHDLTLRLTRNGAGLIEKIVITVLNPTHALYRGFSGE